MCDPRRVRHNKTSSRNTITNIYNRINDIMKELSKQDIINIKMSMTLEGIDPTEENMKKYLEQYDSRSINIKISKNTQRILSSLKEGRETYEDVILRISTKGKL